MQANKVTAWNNAVGCLQVEICNNERLAQLSSMPFMHVESVEQVEEQEDMICGLGGVTPAFKAWWDSLK